MPDGGNVEIDPESCPDALNLLARVLARSVQKLSRHGLERDYVAREEATARLRGRILVAESRRRMIDRQARMICRFDELSADWLPNQILRATCDSLLRCREIVAPIRHELRLAREVLAAVTLFPVTDSLFSQIRFYRNNRNYRLPLAVCRLIHRALMPSEREGLARFHDVLLDEKSMPGLFENFVRNFADWHFPGSKVSAMGINWDGEWNADAAEVLPGMFTDVTIEHPTRKIILDCKYYRTALITRHDRKRLHSSHLYQLVSYLRNKAVDPGWAAVEGILLYPAVEHQLDYQFVLNSHRVRVVSVDLDRPWREIHDALLGICAE